MKWRLKPIKPLRKYPDGIRFGLESQEGQLNGGNMKITLTVKEWKTSLQMLGGYTIKARLEIEGDAELVKKIMELLKSKEEFKIA